ncbi:MAG: EAL domain-containing protein [Deltaproteobacteria bacterium]|nr:EAL domain-containing protein [Deltaproteobacteria bacterium]
MNNCKSQSAAFANTIKRDYQFTEEDARKLKEMLSLMEKYRDDFVKKFYDFIFNFEHASAFLETKEIIELHNEKMKEWFNNLFSGNYDPNYFESLKQISEAHSRISLPTHYTNASFNFVRRYFLQILVTNNHMEYLDVVEKIVDINLDVLTSSYLLEDTKRIIQTIKSIKRALDSKSVVPFYQPIVDNKMNHIVKFECLVRIIEDDGSFLYPMDFLPISKQVKLYDDITKEVIRKSFKDFEKLRMPFSINLSINDIENEKTKTFIYEKLKKYQSIGSKLTFEILESEQIKNYAQILEFIQSVKKYGVKIAIDDFGSGFSNFDHITKMGVDYLKIDGSLIRDLPENKEKQVTVETIVDLAAKLGIETIAEFVNGKDVYEIIKAKGVDYSQGFFFGKPEPINFYLE